MRKTFTAARSSQNFRWDDYQFTRDKDYFWQLCGRYKDYIIVCTRFLASSLRYNKVTLIPFYINTIFCDIFVAYYCNNFSANVVRFEIISR